MCASVTRQYNLVLVKGRWCPAAGEVLHRTGHASQTSLVYSPNEGRWAPRLHSSWGMAHFIFGFTVTVDRPYKIQCCTVYFSVLWWSEPIKSDKVIKRTIKKSLYAPLKQSRFVEIVLMWRWYILWAPNRWCNRKDETLLFYQDLSVHIFFITTAAFPPLRPFLFFFRTDYMIPQTFTVTSERICFYFLRFQFNTF